MKQHLTIGLVLGVLVLVGAGVFYLANHKPAPLPAKAPETSSATVPEGAHRIVLTEDGFKPSKLTIKKGETIAFTTTTKNLFWPASNLHPSHLIYPEFDPQGPIQPDGVWSFTFEKVGEWKFHDHLAPYYTGVITVTE